MDFGEAAARRLFSRLPADAATDGFDFHVHRCHGPYRHRVGDGVACVPEVSRFIFLIALPISRRVVSDTTAPLLRDSKLASSLIASQPLRGIVTRSDNVKRVRSSPSGANAPNEMLLRSSDNSSKPFASERKQWAHGGTLAARA